MNLFDPIDLVSGNFYSEEFNDENAEVTYQSCDGVRFRIHAIYLKVHTEGLVPPEGMTLDEVVHLTEPAATLELLFKFIYPMPQPVLYSGVGFSVLKRLAEAAEKYLVYPAMYACILQMHAAIAKGPKHAIFALGFALRHEYADLADEAALHALDVRLQDVIEAIPSNYHETWFTYHRKWLDVRDQILFTHCDSNEKGKLLRLAGRLSECRKYRDILDSKENKKSRSGFGYVPKPNLETIPPVSELAGIRGHHPSRDDSTHPIPNGETIVIEAADGSQHSIEAANLRACGWFIRPETTRIKVKERSLIIECLLQFMKPRLPPDLEKLAFEEFTELAYASEKYSVYQAMGACRAFMRQMLPRNTPKVFGYGVDHDYWDIMDLAAPLLVGSITSCEELMKILPPTLKLAWARYYQQWHDASLIAMVNGLSQRTTWNGPRSTGVFNPSTSDVNITPSDLLSTLKRLSEGPGTLRDPGAVFFTTLQSPDHRRAFENCRRIAQKMVEEFSTLSSFI